MVDRIYPDSENMYLNFVPLKSHEVDKINFSRSIALLNDNIFLIDSLERIPSAQLGITAFLNKSHKVFKVESVPLNTINKSQESRR